MGFTFGYLSRRNPFSELCRSFFAPRASSAVTIEFAYHYSRQLHFVIHAMTVASLQLLAQNHVFDVLLHGQGVAKTQHNFALGSYLSTLAFM